jgi:hypothetical protein
MTDYKALYNQLRDTIICSGDGLTPEEVIEIVERVMRENKQLFQENWKLQDDIYEARRENKKLKEDIEAERQ